LAYPRVHQGRRFDSTVRGGHSGAVEGGRDCKGEFKPFCSYISPELYNNLIGAAAQGRTNAIRIGLDPMENEAKSEAVKAVERILEQQGIPIKAVITEEMLADAISGHVYILIYALLFMSVLMAVVGGLGLMSTMGTIVTERTREFGIMRTIGRALCNHVAKYSQ
jgi:putative ABC transport system permease protein